MISAWVVTIVTIATGPELGQLQMRGAFETLQRLSKSVPPLKASATPQERAEYGPMKVELEALMTYLGKVQEVMGTGNWNPAYQQNFLTVIRQTVHAGKVFAVLPEEALCWERAGLDLIASYRDLMNRQVAIGKASPDSLHLTKAAHESFRRTYREALARCLTSID